MSIKGIDAQMMITRAPDFVSDTVAALKGGERMQNLLTTQAQADAERQKGIIAGTEEAQAVGMHLEHEDGGGGAAYEAFGGQSGQASAEIVNALLEADVGPSENIIDIKL